jgi:prevent-host-death family protein
MKLVGLREAKQGLNGLVAHAQKERVLLTKHGRPAALLIGVEGQDLETIMLAADARFWRWLEARRQEAPSFSLAEVEARYVPRGRAAAGRAGARRSRTAR